MKERSSSVASNHIEREKGRHSSSARPVAGTNSRVEKSSRKTSSSRSRDSIGRPQYTTTSRAEVSARESRDIRRSISTASRRPSTLRTEVLINEGAAAAARQTAAKRSGPPSVSPPPVPAPALTPPAGLPLNNQFPFPNPTDGNQFPLPMSPGSNQLPFFPFPPLFPFQFPYTSFPQPFMPTTPTQQPLWPTTPTGGSAPATPRPGSSGSHRRLAQGGQFAELRRSVRKLSAQLEAASGQVIAMHRTSDQRHDRRDYFLGQIMSIAHHSQAGDDEPGTRTPINGECYSPTIQSPAAPSSPASTNGGAFSPSLAAWSRRSSFANLPPWDPATARNSVSFVDALDPHRTATGFGTVHSKYRKVVVVGVYATHVTALPIYTYDGRGAARLHPRRRRECVSIRDVDDANPEPAETPHGTLWCEKDADAPCGRFVVQGLSSIHLTEPITHRYEHEATFEGRMMEEDFERLLYLMNKLCWPTQQDFRDQVQKGSSRLNRRPRPRAGLGMIEGSSSEVRDLLASFSAGK